MKSVRTPWFAGARTYATPYYDSRIVVADLNGDGADDVVTLNLQNWSISALLNRGDGRLGARRDYRPVSHPGSLAVGDVNGDGKPDLVVGELKTVAVLVGQGDGRFRLDRRYSVGSAAALEDLNGDGRLDLVASGCPRHTIAVLLSRPSGGLGGQRLYPTRPCARATIGDLTADGSPDLVTANDGNTLSVLVNNGDGTFGSARDYRTRRNVADVAIGDLNGDGRPELIVASHNDLNQGFEIAVFPNTGRGRLGAPSYYQTLGDSLAFGDLNGDGEPELVTLNGDSDVVSVHTNRGDGTFRRLTRIVATPSADDVALDDLNGDERLDLVVANDWGGVSVLANATGFCGVPRVWGETLASAKGKLIRGHCAVGAVGHVRSRTVERGRVISASPRVGALLPPLSRIKLAVSAGR